MRKKDVIRRALEVERKRERGGALTKSPKRFIPKTITYSDVETLLEEILLLKNKKWNRMKKEERKEVERELLRRVISYYLSPRAWEDKTFTSAPSAFFRETKRVNVQDEEEQDLPLPVIVETEDVVVLLVPEKHVGVHPTPESFRPRGWRLGYDKKRKKPVYEFVVYEDDVYESNKHYNKLTLDSLSVKKTDKGVVFLASYSLYRAALNFGRWREFSFVFGIEDGSLFVDRVPYTTSIDEALEWMKPSEVKKAEEEGRLVLRQGDVFFVELKSRRKTIFDYALPRNHEAVETEDGKKVLVKHHEHTALVLPHPHFKPVVRKTIEGRRVVRGWD